MTDQRTSSLGMLLAYFLRQPSARMMLATLPLAVGARLAVGGWSPWDGVVAATVLALWPIHEWVLHVFVLHAKPLKLFGRSFELKTVSGHAAHHADPLDWKLSFIEPRVMVIAGAMYITAWLLLAPTLALGLTGLTTTTLLAIMYEWTHFMIHTDYKPRTRLYRRLWISHRRHHFKNENYWYGVTMLSGDWLLRTQPDPADVETSPTCRTLGMDPEPVS